MQPVKFCITSGETMHDTILFVSIVSVAEKNGQCHMEGMFMSANPEMKGLYKCSGLLQFGPKCADCTGTLDLS